MPSEIGNGGISLPVLLSTHTPRTFKSSKSSSKNVNLLTQQVRVLHQRVCLDVDLSKKRIEGFTELTVIPTTGTLKVIKLDCREMKISGVFVNGRKSNYIFQDLLHINSVTKEGGDDGDEVAEEGEEQINLFDYYSNNLTIHQHHLIKQKLSYVFGEHNYDPRDPPREHISSNTEELSVFFPENLKLELSDIQSLNTPGVEWVI